MQCWFWNIDLDNQEYFAQELLAGRVRQGWGYDDTLDLRTLNTKRLANEPFTDNERVAWERCHPMLLYIKPGDLIAVKNLPSADKFTLVRVRGDYDFLRDEMGDYGHYLPVELLASFHKSSALVAAPFVNALNRERYPIRVTYKHELTIRELSSVEATREERETPEHFKEKVTRWRQELRPHLKAILQKSLSPGDTERLVLELLRRDGMEVSWNAGAGERGADILANVPLGFGLTSSLAIQVKMHWDLDSDVTGLEQLETAFRSHRIQAALLVSMADQLSPQVHNRVETMQKQFNLRVIYGTELYERLLELVADAGLEIDEVP
jgi:hypothetical protein